MGLIQTFGLDSQNNLQIQNGRFVIVEDQEAIRQMLVNALNSIKGNWFLDLNDGLDYFGEIWGKKTIDVEMKSEFQIAISSVIGVTELRRFAIDFAASRQLEVDFSVGTVFSENVDLQEQIQG